MRRALLLVGFLSVGLVVPAAARATTPSGFTVTPSARLGNVQAYFRSVTAPTPTSGWVVGTIHRSTHPGSKWALIEQWNGQSWSRIGLPSMPATADTSTLLSVSSTTPTDTWAVGYTTTPVRNPHSYSHHQLVYRRTAAGWERVTITTDTGAVFNVVFDVSVASPTNVWALARDYHACTQDLLHFDGAHWSVVQANEDCGRSTGTVDGYGRVTAVGSSSAWAVGARCATGTGCGGLATCFGSGCPAGSELSLASQSNFSNSAGTASDLWVFGEQYTQAGFTPYAYHWDGATWQNDAPPQVGEVYRAIHGAVVLPDGDVWTAGTFDTASNTLRTLILHHSTSGWEILGSPNSGKVGGTELFSIAHVGGTATEMWAVGAAGIPASTSDARPFLLHYS
jgi:hypothetical protein